MSNNKSFQRLLVVQALYELSINEKRDQNCIEEIFNNIIEQSDYKKKIKNSSLEFAKKIFKGVNINCDKIDKILKVSTNKKIKVSSMDKLLISIFRPAIYEIEFSDIPKKIVISEYLLIVNRFFGRNETALINGVLDNLQNS
tara:strand:- start:966 stop:1391 length:426 start_codon:yes stop_codon:yes gene_type:complete